MTPFVFSHTWSVKSAPDRVFAVLADVGSYPAWWPQVRSVTRIDSDSGIVVVRSVLPYTLRLVLTRDVEDPVAGLLRVRVGGDLSGYSQWQVRGEEGGAATLALFTQEVEVTGRLGALSRPAAPLLRANHAAMMRGGRKGVTRLLAEGD